MNRFQVGDRVVVAADAKDVTCDYNVLYFAGNVGTVRHIGRNPCQPYSVEFDYVTSSDVREWWVAECELDHHDNLFSRAGT